MRLTADQRKALTGGAPVTQLFDADESKDVLAIWINAPMRRYVEAVMDIENFERGSGFKVTKRISRPRGSRTSPGCVFRTRTYRICGPVAWGIAK